MKVNENKMDETERRQELSSTMFLRSFYDFDMITPLKITIEVIVKKRLI